MGFWDRLSKKRSTADFLGWTEGTQVHLPKSGKLLSDPWYKLVFVLFPLTANRTIECDCSEFVLQLRSGGAVPSVGLALSLDETFRCRPGQKCPAIMPAKAISWRQDGGSHYAHVFSVAEKDTPAALIVRGKTHPLGNMLPPVDSKQFLGGPADTPGEALGSMSLAAGVPYMYRCEDPGSLTAYRPPAAPGDGIVAVWESPKFNVVVVRVPSSIMDGGRSLTEEGIRIVLEKGPSASARGVILRIPGQPAPYGLADRFQLDLNKTVLSPGGRLEFLYDYRGPYSALLAQDCKLAVAVAPEVGWKSVRGFSMPGFESQVPDGTVLIGGPR